MKHFFTLVKYEYIKIFTNTMNRNVLIISVVALLMIGFSNTLASGEYYHEVTGQGTGLEALNLDKAVVKQHTGEMDTALLKETIITAQVALKEEENFVLNTRGNLRLKPQIHITSVLPYSNIYYFLNGVYDGRLPVEGIEKPIEKIPLGDMDDFYQTYTVYLAEHINTNPYLTQVEKEKHSAMIKEIKTPFYNDYMDGWKEVLKQFEILGVITLLFVGIVSANIFTQEYVCKTDAVALSSKHGKHGFILAKFVAGITTAAGASILFSLLLAIPLYLHGFDGGNVPIQLIYPYSTYPITVAQAVVGCCLLFVAVSACFASFGMLVSAMCKKSFASIVIVLLVISLPMYIPLVDNRILLGIRSLLPAIIFQFNTEFSQYFYTFGKLSFTPYVFYWMASMVGIMVFLLLAYHTFKHHQVS